LCIIEVDIIYPCLLVSSKGCNLCTDFEKSITLCESWLMLLAYFGSPYLAAVSYFAEAHLLGQVLLLWLEAFTLNLILVEY
jgi:hypothetical protein